MSPPYQCQEFRCIRVWNSYDVQRVKVLIATPWTSCTKVDALPKELWQSHTQKRFNKLDKRTPSPPPLRGAQRHTPSLHILVDFIEGNIRRLAEYAGKATMHPAIQSLKRLKDSILQLYFTIKYWTISFFPTPENILHEVSDPRSKKRVKKHLTKKRKKN